MANQPKKRLVSEETSSTQLTVARWKGGELSRQSDAVANEQAIALVYNGISHAVMMATPSDLEDFAVGFSLTESIVEQASEIYAMEIQSQPKGIELEIQISSERFAKLKEVRRRQVGVSGCGLCGAESLDDAIRPIVQAEHARKSAALSHSSVLKSLQEFERRQIYRAETGAIHAAAWCSADGTIEEVREDIGRHNAVDKLVGALSRAGLGPELETGGECSYLLLSSRVSFEIIQKAVTVGIGCIVAVSAPTSLAVSRAEDAGICIVGRASSEQLVVYTHSAGVNFA